MTTKYEPTNDSDFDLTYRDWLYGDNRAAVLTVLSAEQLSELESVVYGLLATPLYAMDGRLRDFATSLAIEFHARWIV